MNVPANHILVQHGSMSIPVPRNLFKGDDAVIVEDKAAEFKQTLMERYPWLTENAVDVIFKNSKRIILENMDEETKGCSTARSMVAKGNIDGAIRHLEKWCERDSNSVNTWYYLGQLYFDIGETEKGYKAMNRGRSLI